jgi:hypothetical protein
MPIVPVETELYDLLGVKPNADEGTAYLSLGILERES